MKTLSGFKAGDSRRPYGADLKNNLAYRIVRAYASELIFSRVQKPPVLLVERIGAFPLFRGNPPSRQGWSDVTGEHQAAIRRRRPRHR